MTNNVNIVDQRTRQALPVKTIEHRKPSTYAPLSDLENVSVLERVTSTDSPARCARLSGNDPDLKGGQRQRGQAQAERQQNPQPQHPVRHQIQPVQSHINPQSSD